MKRFLYFLLIIMVSIQFIACKQELPENETSTDAPINENVFERPEVTENFSTEIVDGTISLDSTKRIEINTLLSSVMSIEHAQVLKTGIAFCPGPFDLVLSTNPDDNTITETFTVTKFFSSGSDSFEVSNTAEISAEITNKKSGKAFNYKVTISNDAEKHSLVISYGDNKLETNTTFKPSPVVSYIINNATVSEEEFYKYDNALALALYNRLSVVAGTAFGTEADNSAFLLCPEIKSYIHTKAADQDNSKTNIIMVSANSYTPSTKCTNVATVSIEVDGHSFLIKAERNDTAFHPADELFDYTNWAEWQILKFVYDDVVYKISSVKE